MNPNGSISEILSHKGSQVWSIAPEAMVFDAIQMMADAGPDAIEIDCRSRERWPVYGELS